MSNPVGRLALRVEGNYWNAYYALPDTMEGALLLGSIAFNLVANNLGRKQAFMEMMQAAVAEVIMREQGGSMKWNEPQRAPEHERSGRA